MAGGGILKNTAVVGALTAFSRLLGLVREMLQSRLIGAGVEQSAFTLAFALPNMARKLFGEGALTAAFVPVFKGEVERGDIESARRLARSVLAMVLLALGAVVTLTVLVLTAGLNFCDGLSPRAELTLRLVRILFPYMIFICGAAFGMGVLNALGKFAEGAFMPAMLNVLWIATLAVLCFFPGASVETRVTVVCWAILAGGAAQMTFLFHCMSRRGYSPLRKLFERFTDVLLMRDDKVRLVWRNTAIAAAGAGAVQVNYMLDQVLAQCAAPWAAGVIGYAERLMDMPLGVIGVAFGTVLLPTFAGMFAKNDLDGARRALASSVVALMAVMLPAAVGMCVLATDITAVIYEGSAFDATATLRVSRALAVYAVGLWVFGLQKSLVPWFHAQGDMKTPLRISVGTVFLNAALNLLAVLLLPIEWRHVGLAASTVLCALVGCVCLLGLARRKNGSLGLGMTAPALTKLVAGALFMGAALYGSRPWLGGFNRYLALTLEIFVGLVAYVSSLALIGGLAPLRQALHRGR